MGVINITTRRTSMGNISGGAMPHGVQNTAVGQVHHATPRMWNTTKYDGLPEMLGRIGAATQGLLDLSLQIRDREEARQVDEFVHLTMAKTDNDFRDNTPIADGEYAGQPRGLLNRTGKGLKTACEEAYKVFDDNATAIAKERKYSSRVVEEGRRRMLPYNRGINNQLKDRQTSEYRRIELEDAAANVKMQEEQYVAADNVEIYPQLMEAYARTCALRGMSPAAAQLARQQYARNLLPEVYSKVASGYSTKAQFEHDKDQLKNNPQFLAKFIAGEHHGDVGGDMFFEQPAVRDEMRKIIDKREAAFLRDKMIELRESDAKFETDFHNDKDGTALPQDPTPETMQKFDEACVAKYAEYYAGMAAAYGDIAPEVVKNCKKKLEDYQKAAIESSHNLKTATEKQKVLAEKAVVDTNEKQLSTALIQMRVSEMSGNFNPGERTKAKAGIWRTYQACVNKGLISNSFAETFRKQLREDMNADKLEGMRELYSALRLPAGIVADGKLTAAEGKEMTESEIDYYLPREEDGVQIREEANKIDAPTIIQWSAELSRMLDNLGPGVDRKAAVRDMIDGMKRKNIANNLDAILQEMAAVQADQKLKSLASKNFADLQGEKQAGSAAGSTSYLHRKQ